MSRWNRHTISNGTLTFALTRLREVGENGLTRADFEREFGSDREGRAVMSELRKRGLAAVVVAKQGDRDVYRLARDYDEFRAYKSSLESRITELREAINGLEEAWRKGGIQEKQPELL